MSFKKMSTQQIHNQNDTSFRNRQNNQLPQSKKTNTKNRHNINSDYDNADDDNNLLANCYSIIQQQQTYIQKLQNDNIRKDSIISNLLRNNHGKKSNITYQQNDNQHFLYIQQLKLRIEQLQNKLEQAVHQNECYQLQIQNRNKQIIQFIKKVRQHERKENQLIQQIEEDKQYVIKLKQAYQAKIAKLLSQIRKKVEQDVQKMKQKVQKIQNKQQININQKQHSLQSQQLVQKGSKNYEQNFQHEMKTPNKTAYKSKYCDNSTLSSIGSNIISSKKKTINVNSQNPTSNSELKINKLVNTPYRTLNKMKDQNQQIQTIQQSNRYKILQSDKKRNNYSNNRMLHNIKDVQFVTDSYEDTQSQQSSIYCQIEQQPTNQKIRNKNKPKLISIQNIIKQFAHCDEEMYNYPNKKLNQSMQKSNQKRDIDQKTSPAKITKILEQLSIKIKRFESQQLQIP